MVALGCVSVGHYVKGRNNRETFGDAHQLKLITKKNENIFLKRVREREEKYFINSTLQHILPKKKKKDALRDEFRTK